MTNGERFPPGASQSRARLLISCNRNKCSRIHERLHAPQDDRYGFLIFRQRRLQVVAPRFAATKRSELNYHQERCDTARLGATRERGWRLLSKTWQVLHPSCGESASAKDSPPCCGVSFSETGGGG